MINNLEAYKVFYYVAKCGSVTKAAGELSISQPAVSQAIKQLENTLDAALFHRAAKGVRLTSEGELLYSYVAKGYEQIEMGVKKVHQMQNMELGEVRIGASDMTLQFYLLPYLEQFHEKYPKIRVTVTNAPTPETLKHLADGKIDFGIVSTPIEPHPHLKVTAVKEISDIFVAGKKFEHLKGKQLSYHKLEQYPVMCLEGATSTRRYVEEFLATEGVALKPEFELATSDMLIQFAIRNLGIASVVSEFAAEQMKNGTLFALQFDREIPKRQFCIVADDRVPLSAAAAKLLDSLVCEVVETV